MDTALPKNVVVQKRRKTVVILLVAVVCVVALAWLLRRSVAASLDKTDFTTAVVEKGDIENTLTASGEVVPEFEEILASPITASIQKVALDAGSHVETGQSVLTLDKSAARVEYEKQQFQLESKRNSIRKLKLELDKSFYDLKSNNDIKQLRISSLQAAVENAKRLFKAGGGTREDIERAELDLKVAVLEKKQLENEISSRQQTMQVEMRESQIAADIQQNDLRELERKLQLADVVATRPGVVTWVNKNIGAAVREGESLARIADLESFKITGSITDEFMDQLRLSMPVIIRINDVQLRGTITTIHPSIQNNIGTFEVQVAERNSKLFRPNMKVDLFPVTAVHRQVLRVANGLAFKGPSIQDIFVVRGDKAIRRTVHTGMSNFDWIEIKDGVQPGDVIITSDMTEYKHYTEITISK
ncbi:MAG: HlyD family efflux transporter periplasmic adaptor subunit [Williamsia sp.]|nr:HlyD family efflux transporter periplasmic adaptor subunit [Williamsia sp.]